MVLDRRRFSLLLATAAALPAGVAVGPGSGTAAGQGTVADMLGRVIRLSLPAKRIVLLDARDILSMALLHAEPSRLVAGWAAPETLDSDLVRSQYEPRPGGQGAIPVVGGRTAETVSVESILALAPDLVVSTTHMDPEQGESALTRHLEAAGIPVIFSNVSSNRQAEDAGKGGPLHDLRRLMRMWGAVLGRQEQASAFTDFAAGRLAMVRERLGVVAPCKTYLEIQSTYDDCCWAAGTRIWGDLLALAGGQNLSAVDSPWYAQVAIEQLIAEKPDAYIATGGAFASGMRPAIGPGHDPDEGREGLRRLCKRTGFGSLPAVRSGRVHGIWSGLVAIQPLNILFVEVAAKWLHPDVFKGTWPEDTLAEINRRFLAKPLEAPCWLSLDRETGNG
mgnify:CR=1 FL=1